MGFKKTVDNLLYFIILCCQMYVCRVVLKHCKRLVAASIEDALWQFRLRRILTICMCRFGPNLSRETMSSPLRLFEIITSLDVLEKDVGLNRDRAIAFLLQVSLNVSFSSSDMLLKDQIRLFYKWLAYLSKSCWISNGSPLNHVTILSATLVT